MNIVQHGPTANAITNAGSLNVVSDLDPIEISIVMPCLNEAETLTFCIDEAMQALADLGLRGEVVIADNGSSDGSQRIAAQAGARVVEVVDKGYGSALRGGILACRGKWIVMADADGSYAFSHLPRFVEKLREGFDLVMGNRFLGGIQKGAMPLKHRYLGNPVLSGIGRLFFHCNAHDFHCGLRGFSREAFDRMQLSTTGMEFASEMVIKATLKQMRVTEVPTVLRPDGRSRPPHLNSWRDGWRHLRFMLLFCPRWLFVIPAAVAIIVGGFLLVMIAGKGVWWVAGVGLSTNTAMAAAMLVVLGFQTLLCGVFARHLSASTGHLPPSRTIDLLQKRVSLEVGVVAGAMMSLGGLVLLGSALRVW